MLRLGQICQPPKLFCLDLSSYLQQSSDYLCVYFVSLSQTGKMQLDQQVDILALQGHLIS